MIYTLVKSEQGIHPVNKPACDLFNSMGNGERVFFKKVQQSALRSMAQNRLYWMWVTEIANHRGDTKEDIHTRCKHRYALPILIRDDLEIADLFDSIRSIGGSTAMDLEMRISDSLISTTQLSATQFAEMLNEIEMSARQRGIDLTRPADLYEASL